MENIYAGITAGISEFKKSPSALIERAEGKPIALLNHNKPTAYLLPAKLYESLLELIEDRDLLNIASKRLTERSQAIPVDINDL